MHNIKITFKRKISCNVLVDTEDMFDGTTGSLNGLFKKSQETSISDLLLPLKKRGTKVISE